VRYATNSRAEANFGNCKLEKNANFRRNFSLTKIYKKENDWTTKARKNLGRKFRKLDQNSGKLKVKKYSVKMANFSKFPEKFDKQNFEKKDAFSGEKLRC